MTTTIPPRSGEHADPSACPPTAGGRRALRGAWHIGLRAEIESMFARLSGCYVLADLCESGVPSLDHRSRLVQMRIEEHEDPAWRAWLSRSRERARAKRVASDAEYAAKRKAQMRAAYERRRARVAADPAFAERERERWKRNAAARKARS